MLCFKAVVDASLADPSHLAFGSVVSVPREGRDQRGFFQELLRSSACMISDGTSSLEAKLSREDEGFDHEVRDAWRIKIWTMSLDRC